MLRKKVVIIGSGMGGLSTGAILSKNGFEVTVLEQGSQIGGCLQCFKRNGAKFETGMHFVGSADKGQVLDLFLDYLEIKPEIKLSRLDVNGYDVVNINGQEFKYANGKEAFINQLSLYFPHQKDNIRNFYDVVEKVANASSLRALKQSNVISPITTEFQLRSINDVLDSVVTDPLLAKVLVGNLPLYAAERNKTPFATLAFIMDFYNKSAFRIVGGSDTIAFALKNTIERHGGRVLVKKNAVKIVCDDKKAVGINTEDGDFFEADYVVSAIHPANTLKLTDSKLIRPAFRNRIANIPQTTGCFSVYLKFNNNTVPYMNHNLYAYKYGTPWDCEHYTDNNWPKGFLYMHFCNEENPRFASTGVVLSYMTMNELDKWKDTKVGKRGTDYLEFKKRKAEKLLRSLEETCPDIIGNVESYYTSTPLTYFDYTRVPDGSMYGVVHDVTKSVEYRVPHKTKIPNLFLTGQNINSHGILGVLVGTVITCGEFIPSEYLYRQITMNKS